MFAKSKLSSAPSSDRSSSAFSLARRSSRSLFMSTRFSQSTAFGPKVATIAGCSFAVSFQGDRKSPANAIRSIPCAHDRAREHDSLLAQEHRPQPDQAQALAVELAHLAQDVGLLHPLDDAAVLDPHVIEEAGLAGPLGRGSAVEPAGRGARHG